MSIYERLLAVIPAKDVNLPKSAADQAQVDGIVNGIFVIAGAVTIIFILIGAIRYATSQGDANAVKTAKEMIIYSLVGMVMVGMAFAIVQIVILVVNS
jgi:hypothetical protein